MFLIVDSSDPQNVLFYELCTWARGISREKYRQLRDILQRHFQIQLPSLQQKLERLQQLTGVEPQYIDCCVNGCMAYTEKFSDLTDCHLCKNKQKPTESRYRPGTQIARKQFVYIPIISRLKYQFSIPGQAQILKQYRREQEETYSEGVYRDFWDGWIAKSFLQDQKNLLNGCRDIAFQLSLDGVQLTEKKSYSIIDSSAIECQLANHDNKSPL